MGRGTARRMRAVEGPRCEAGFNNRARNRSRVFHHVRCCNSKQLHAVTPDELVPPDIVLGLRFEIVDAAVDFNHQLADGQ